MPAEPLRASVPEAERPTAPAPEAKPPMSLNEALTGVPTPEAPAQPETLRETEDRLAREGMAKLNELGKNLNLQAEAGAQEFKHETKSVWGRMKERLFKKKDETPVKGEEDIMKEVEKADAVYATFKAKYDEVMASGDQAGLKSLERSLSQAYEQLAPQVAAEGAAEGKAWKKAVKGQEAPQITEAGAKLNDVARRLQEVRGRLGGAPAPKAESLPAAEPEAKAASSRAEKELDDAIARGVAEFEAERAAAAGVPAAPEAPAQAEDPDAAERETLLKKSAGKPGEKLVDDYLKMKKLLSDKNGTIVRTTFNETKGEIRVNYEDGGEMRIYASGLRLRVHPGGKVEEIKPQAEIVEEPESPEETFTGAEKAELRAGAEALRGQAPVSGEIEAKPAAAEAPADVPGVVVDPEALKMKVVTSSESPTASGEIGGEMPVEDAQIIESAPAETAEAAPDSDLEFIPAPKAPEAPPAEALAPEKKESPFDKLAAGMDAAAVEALKMPEAAESPKTFATKVGKLPADRFLELFKAAGAVDESAAKDLADQFKLDAEGFNDLRKKLSAAVKKRQKG